VKTYTVEGVYSGKVRLITSADSWSEAAKIFEIDGGEDSAEILEPSKINPDMATMRERPWGA